MTIKPVRLVLGPPCVDTVPGWAEAAGAIGYPDAKPITAAELAEGPDCPRCTKPTELRGEKRVPYCRTCHQFVVGGKLGDCRSRDGRE